MLTHRSLARRLFLMILLTGILPMIIISGVSLILLRPVLTELDVLDIVERELNDQALAARNIISTNPGLTTAKLNEDRQVLMDLYKIALFPTIIPTGQESMGLLKRART